MFRCSKCDVSFLQADAPDLNSTTALSLNEEFEQKITFNFNLPPNIDNFQEVVPLGELAINLIDIVAEKCKFRSDVVCVSLLG